MEEYIKYLQQELNARSNKENYILKCDEDAVKNYNENLCCKCKKNKQKYKDDYEYHCNVLPQPFFGNIINPEILIIANNPSYAKYDDEYDTKLFLSKNELNEYIEILKRVNFFDTFNDDNRYFYNTWNWWHRKVTGNLAINSKDKKGKVGIINLCGYHSKYFNEEHYKNFPSFNEEILDNLIKIGEKKNKKFVIIFVWKGTQEILEKKYKKELNNIPHLYLTKGNSFGNTNTLEQIIKDKSVRDKYKETLELKAIKKLTYFFNSNN